MSDLDSEDLYHPTSVPETPLTLLNFRRKISEENSENLKFLLRTRKAQFESQFANTGAAGEPGVDHTQLTIDVWKHTRRPTGPWFMDSDILH